MSDLLGIITVKCQRDCRLKPRVGREWDMHLCPERGKGLGPEQITEVGLKVQLF